ncbi:DUF2867 domain-containing protein [Halodesulfovibrio aestuarii]|uniref:DUF2867 domain-containing protein n=1 Tax=Halodesulfovibrio aestuarii TaxID=126333 RepID=A0A8G2C702_9BACT|nr:DUF2867 domain-containing protein [Halodesulfovibrio aestuarii]SHI54495.1 Protein of unknown function [Halodesulfovibrio aestuarii]
MKINKYATQPDGSMILYDWNGAVHYIDSYQLIMSNPDKLSIDTVANIIFASDPPKWQKALTRLRDSIVGFFGLKTGMPSESPQPQSDPTQSQLVDKIGLFPVINRSDSEIVMELDDKHLLFRASLLMRKLQNSDQYSVFLTTIVQFHNLWGRMYFFPVKPFHRIIVTQSLKRLLRQHNELIPQDSLP